MSSAIITSIVLHTIAASLHLAALGFALVIGGDMKSLPSGQSDAERKNMKILWVTCLTLFGSALALQAIA